MQEQLRTLIEQHCETVANETKLLSTILSQLKDTGSIRQAIKGSIELAHKIRGSSGSLGFADVYAAATSLETFLRALDRETLPPMSEVEQVFGRFAALDDKVAQMTPERSSLYHVDVTQLTRPQAKSA